MSPYLEELDSLEPRSKRRKLIDLEPEMNPEEENPEMENSDPFLIYKAKGFSGTRLLLKAEGIHKKPRRLDRFAQI